MQIELSEPFGVPIPSKSRPVGAEESLKERQSEEKDANQMQMGKKRREMEVGSVTPKESSVFLLLSPPDTSYYPRVPNPWRARGYSNISVSSPVANSRPPTGIRCSPDHTAVHSPPHAPLCVISPLHEEPSAPQRISKKLCS